MTATRCPLLGGADHGSDVLIGSCPNLPACIRLSYLFGDARKKKRAQEVEAH